MALTTWLLGGLGFVLGGPIGALIGALIGYTVDRRVQQFALGYETENTTKTRTQTTTGDIRVSLIVLIACVMKADGRVLKSEVNYIKPFLLKTYGEEGAKQALQLLKQLLERDIDYIAVAQQIGQNVSYSVRLELIHVLLGLAASDGDFDPREERMIEQIANCMQVTTKDYQSLLSLYKKTQDVNWAYTALEIEPTVTDEEVKKAYRRMAMKYHPDKVATSDESLKQQATEKFRAVNEAYEHIKSVRGLK